MVTIVCTHDKLHRMLDLRTLHVPDVLFVILWRFATAGRRGSVCCVWDSRVRVNRSFHPHIRSHTMLAWIKEQMKYKCPRLSVCILLGDFPGHLVEFSTHGRWHNIKVKQKWNYLGGEWRKGRLYLETYFLYALLNRYTETSTVNHTRQHEQKWGCSSCFFNTRFLDFYIMYFILMFYNILACYMYGCQFNTFI